MSLPTSPNPGARYRSKTLAAWLALLLGTLGAHRFYLHGWRDRLGWLHLPPTLAGLHGVLRLRDLGQDDRLAWLLVPLLGLMISAAMITGIVHALTPDETWDAHHNPGQPVTATGWGPVLAAIFGLMVGGAVLTGTIAYSGQMFFEWQLEGVRAARP
jgi:TM2 domain